MPYACQQFLYIVKYGDVFWGALRDNPERWKIIELAFFDGKLT